MSDNPTCDRCGASYQDVEPAKDCDWCVSIFEDEAVKCSNCGEEISLKPVTTAVEAHKKISQHHRECV